MAVRQEEKIVVQKIYSGTEDEEITDYCKTTCTYSLLVVTCSKHQKIANYNQPPTQAVPSSLRLLVAGLSPRRPGFPPGQSK
jgi:hypothetical protein